ncbi:MAG: hypothetical protein HQK87_05145 [Nitrospinae bacterium]|nr:hypothetical protein [Nitrospinota bacterium]
MPETRYVSRQEAATKTKANLAIPYKKATGSGGARTPAAAGKSGQADEASARNSAGQGPTPPASAKGTGQPPKEDASTRAAREVLQGTGGKVNTAP